MSESGRADWIASRVPAVGVALVIVFALFLLLPRPNVEQPERAAAPPAQPHTPEFAPEFAPKPVDPELVKLRTSGSEVQRDFANGVFQADDPVEKLLAKHKPTLRLGNMLHVILVYAPEEWGGDRRTPSEVVVVFVADGKLLLALTRVETPPGQYRALSFINEWMTQAEPRMIDTSFWKEVETLLDLHHPAVVTAHMAVAGPGVWNRVFLP